MKRPSRTLHAIAFIVGVLACAYVAVVGLMGVLSVHSWLQRGVAQRAIWIACGAVLMILPGIAVAALSVWYLRRSRGVIDPRRGFEVLPRE